MEGYPYSQKQAVCQYPSVQIQMPAMTLDIQTQCNNLCESPHNKMRGLWTISHLSLKYSSCAPNVSSMSAAIGGYDMCSIWLVCNLYRLPVASLTVGLNIFPIMESFSWCLVKGNVSGYYRNFSSLRARTVLDITVVAVIAARPAKRRSLSDSDVIVTTHGLRV